MKIKTISSIVLSSVLSLPLLAQASPWFTGPLLAPGGHTMPAGHQNYETYLFFTDNLGIYNQHWHSQSAPKAKTISPTFIFTQGLNNFMDFQFIAPYNFNSKSGQHDSHIGDVSAVLGFQLLHAEEHSWMPDLRFTVQEGFPTGKYKNLNPLKLGTDATGSGAYQTSFGFNFQKLNELSSGHYLRTRLSFTYTIPSSVTVTNVNTYGGTLGTNGRVHPGKKFATVLGFEYTLTQHWVPALDISYSHTSKTTFSGIPGVTASGTTASVGGPSSDQLSLAPAVEYNFNSHLGVIGGAWFTVTGRDSSRFAGGAIALNYFV